MFSIRPLSGGLLVVLLPALPLVAASPRGYPDRPASVAPTVVQHKVARGETLWSISQKHRTSVGAVMDYNHLPDHNVREGMILRIPPRVADNGGYYHAPRIHVVKRGEDFWGIAERYRVPSSQLAKANPNINPNRIHEDMELIIPSQEGTVPPNQDTPAPKPQPQPQPGSMIQHTVGENETFYSIGRRYGVPMDRVVAANPTVRPERLRAGMKVWVPTRNGATPAPAPNKPRQTENTARVRGSTHKVKEDESIASIAKMHGVSEAALLRENDLEADDVIFVDDVLRIPGTSSGTVYSSAAPAQTKPSTSTTSTSTASKPKPQTKPASSGGSTPANTVGTDGTIRSYIVSDGENENTICDAFGITKQQLYDYNRLSPTTKLKAGDEITIPRVAKKR